MNDEFIDFIINDQLHDLPLTPKKMFGGWGIYYEDRFFAIVYKDELYFKTNEKTVEKYLSYKMKPFRPNEKQTLKNYYLVPGEILENAHKLKKWALESAQL